MICKHCHNSIADDSIFCPSCGQKIEMSAPISSPVFQRAGDLGNGAPNMATNRNINRRPPSSPSLNDPGPFRTANSLPPCAVAPTPAYTSAVDRNKAVLKWVRTHKKALLIAAACLLLTSVFVIISANMGPKSTTEIKKDLANRYSNTYVDNDLISMNVDSVDIEDRKTRDDTDEVYCKVRLESDTFSVTAYLLLAYQRYNHNDWRLEGVESYAPEEVEIIRNTQAMRDIVVSCVQMGNTNYQDIENMIERESVQCSNNTVQYTFRVSDYSEIISTTGTLVSTLTMGGSLEEGYYWYADVIDDEVQILWNVEGTWECYKPAYLCSYDFEISINFLSVDSVDCYWSYDYDDNSGLGFGYYSTGDGSDCWVSEADSEKIEIGVHYGSALLSNIFVTFYADGSAEVHFGYDGAGNLYRSY